MKEESWEQYARKTKYFGQWKNIEDVIDDLTGSGYLKALNPAHRTERHDRWKQENPNFPTDQEVLWASYDYEDYSGYAAVLFEKDGKLMEWGASHCSCRGLEEEDGKFIATETSWGALAMRDPLGLLHGSWARSPEAIETLRLLIKNKKDIK